MVSRSSWETPSESDPGKEQSARSLAPRRGARIPAVDATIVMRFPGRVDFGQDRLAGRCDRDVVRLIVGSPLHFDGPLLESTLADDHAEGDADQVGVLELHAGPLLAVVDQDVVTG